MFCLLSHFRHANNMLTLSFLRMKSYSTPYKSKEYINIVLPNKGVCTLIDVIVVNPTHFLLLGTISTCDFATSRPTQTRTPSCLTLPLHDKIN